MIDHPTTPDLLAKLENALPMAARLTPELRTSLHGQMDGATIPATATVTWIYYMGDEGGIVCKLDLGFTSRKEPYVSITHLRFDPRLPLARQITVYQKHRVKGLRRQPG